ncbi:MAG: histidine phosphatase family protein [Vescimonas sp.]
MKLTLLRHAQTEGSLRNLYYGAADIPALPESLAELHRRAGDYPTAQRYYTSGMLRTEQTLAAIYGNVPHTRLPGLREMDFGDFEMKSYEELKDTPAYQAWITDVEHNPCPHGRAPRRCCGAALRPSPRWCRGRRTPSASSTAASRRG